MCLKANGPTVFLQAAADGTGQTAVCSQEAAPQADDAGSDQRAHQAGQPAGRPPGGLRGWRGAAHSPELLQVSQGSRWIPNEKNEATVITFKAPEKKHVFFLDFSFLAAGNV